MSNQAKGSNIIAVLSAAVTIGFIFGLVASFNHILSNRYIQYKTVRLIILSFQQFLHKWLILTVIISLAFFIGVWLAGKIILPNIIKVFIRKKTLQKIILACIVCSIFFFFCSWTINHYWLPRKFHPVSLLAYLGILLFTILLGWMLIKEKDEALLRFFKTEYIKRTSAVLVLVLITFNLIFLVDNKINCPRTPNVVLIGVDTLRADHLKCYGYDRETSPEVDELAKESVLFSECISHIPTTTPSFASILTSKRPISHGVLGNNFIGYRLDNRHMTLAELLKNRGYNTAAFVSGWTLRRNSNLTQGFDVYDDHRERKAELVNKEVFRWLEKHKKRKFFLFVHYFDPHAKYEPPPPYDGYFTYTTKPHDISKIPPHLRYRNISDPSFYIAKYDGEIKYTDYHIGQLLKKISELELTDI
ncbi:MAG: sulfatase-like hydrolase/transferase [Planctomycetota bacterium]|jgi:glucan phosphoethanolaminetransferase (alkaline phosphatase superfamily)